MEQRTKSRSSPTGLGFDFLETRWLAGGSNLTSISVGLHDEAHDVVIDPYFLPSQVSYGLNTNIPDRGGPPVDWEVVTFVQSSASFLLRGEKIRHGGS